MAVDRIRIGNGCGFWGDNLDAPLLLAEQGRLHYLTLEYLAELTMSILALQKQRDAQAGYATDFLDVLERLCPLLEAQPELKIITNAGGMNPAACAAKARALLDRAGLTDRILATVAGDDLLPQLDRLLAEGHTFANLDTAEPLTAVRARVVSANAYLGARPIVAALHAGASIVITGRVADASLTLSPAVHEFGWDWEDWNRLSAGTIAGHLIECGAQATGGLWCNWQDARDMANVGYPIAEISASGSLWITKPADTGGAVNCETVSEQLLYEVGDPAAYLTPDVTADFTSVTLKQADRDSVSVEGARGKPATDTYKVSIAYRDGFMSSGTLTIFGPDAPAKGRLCGEMILQRLRRAGVELAMTNVECQGAGACVPGVRKETTASTLDPPEVVLRVSARDSRRSAVERFTKEFAPLVTSGLPGVTGYTTGRPPVREVFAYWPALVPKRTVRPEVRIMRNERGSVCTKSVVV
jgi:Acyclic terpene utilisation family protein AtuA